MASRAGELWENPVTGERCVVVAGDDEDPDAGIAVELTVAPGGAVVGEHVHSYIHETFEVLDGEVGFSLDGKESTGGPGTKVNVPPGRKHDWWNAGTDPARVLVKVAPAERFGEMIKTLFGLARDGKVNAKGMPNPLQLAVFAKEFRPEAEFTSPPPAVQTVLFGILSPIGKALGYRATYPQYDAPHGHVEVPADLRDVTLLGAPLHGEGTVVPTGPCPTRAETPGTQSLSGVAIDNDAVNTRQRKTLRTGRE